MRDHATSSTRSKLQTSIKDMGNTARLPDMEPSKSGTCPPIHPLPTGRPTRRLDWPQQGGNARTRPCTPDAMLPLPPAPALALLHVSQGRCSLMPAMVGARCLAALDSCIQRLPDPCGTRLGLGEVPWHGPWCVLSDTFAKSILGCIGESSVMYVPAPLSLFGRARLSGEVTGCRM
jgi:hypothetical protein